MRHSVEIAVKNRIIEHGQGWCFTSMHFSDLGSDPSIRKAKYDPAHCRIRLI